MDRSLRWKSLFLFALVVLSVLYLLPSSGQKLPPWYEKAFSNKVELGLDLQGGLHIVYGVDLDRVVDDKAGEIKRDLDDRLAEKGLKAEVKTPRTPIGSVFIIPEKAEDKAKIDSGFLSDYTDSLDKVECPANLEGRERAICLRVATGYAEKIQASAIDQAIKTIKDRVDRFGIAEATIVKKGFDIIVELPGADKAGIERLKRIIDRTALLEFKIVQNDNPYMGQLKNKVEGDAVAKEKGITVAADDWETEKGEVMHDFYLSAKDKTEVLPAAEAEKLHCAEVKNKTSDGFYKCALTGRQIMEQYLASLPPELAPPGETQIAFEKMERNAALIPVTGTPTAPEVLWRSYLVTRTASLTGTGVSQADVTWNPTTNRPEVLVTFNRQGARLFGDLTTKNVGRKMAIILDEEVSSAPHIQGPITGGKSTITMGGGRDNARVQKDAQDLVNVLRTGALPAPLKQESESQIGATLGQDAIDRAQISMLVGALIVIAMMLYFYKLSGFIANVAMVLNILFQLSILAMFQATLTLPGIAGLVLTIGMAVDSNIIIYERIREELKSGKTIKSAVDAGFGRAFWTVFDAHVTNFVAGFVLLEYGTGPIRGFAVMLLIGVVVNLFTATWVSRLFFEIWLNRRRNSTAPLSI
jgi:preprotein translocase subunit SecD